MKLKKMKKTLGTLAMVGILGVATATPVFADGASGNTIIQGNTDHEGQTKITATLTKAYTVTIPTSIAISPDASATTEYAFNVKAKNVVLGNGEKLYVTLKSDNTFNLVGDGSNPGEGTIDYAIYNSAKQVTASSAADANLIRTFEQKPDEQTETCKLKDIKFNVTKAGDFAGVLTFVTTIK